MVFENKEHMKLADYIRTELDDGATFEEILEEYDLTPEEVFVELFIAGLINETTLENRLLDFN